MPEDLPDPERTRIEDPREMNSRESSAPTLPREGPETAVTGAGEAPAPESRPGLNVKGAIGPYRILEQIGQGGMGTVYLAEQSAPIRRRVAIKVIRPGMDSREIFARFDAERKTLALMSHPNIAQILDAGETEDSRPYFVMEYVTGLALSDYCDAHKVPLVERLALLQEVCAAIQHAHQRGIIHRDLKPTNILVTTDDGRPIPKVIDFGIAKATENAAGEATMQTQIGSIVGTPEYASPEQIGSSMEIDSRSDIYSLGVILYELATGAPPFRFRGRRVRWQQVQRIVREEEPVAPSRAIAESAELLAIAAKRSTSPAALVRQVRGELDWIVLRSLEKEPARRYQTPAALAADLARLQKNEPLEASPPSRLYRFRKLVKRHFVASIAIAAAAATLSVSGVIFAVRLKAERDYATQQAQLARHERDRAVAARDFLLGVVQSANPYQAPNPARRVDALFEAAAKSLSGRFPNDPEIEAQLLQQFGRSLMALERNEAARDALERAEQLLAGRATDTHPVLVETRGRLVDLYRLRREHTRALELAERQLALCGPQSTLSPITCLAIRNDHIEVTMAAGDAQNAQEEIEGALEFAKYTHSEANYEAVFTDYLAGKALRDLGRTSDSAQAFLRLVDRTVKAVPPKHPGLLTDMIWLGWTAYDLGETGLARRFSDYALSGRRALYGEATRYFFEVVQQRAIVAFGGGDLPRSVADFRFLLDTVPEGEPALAVFRESASAWLALTDSDHAATLDLAALEASRATAVGPDASGMAELRLLLSAVALKRHETRVASRFLSRANSGGGIDGRPFLAPLALVLKAHVARAEGRQPDAARLEAEAERLLATQGRRQFDPVARRWVGAPPARGSELASILLTTARHIGDVRKAPF
jgi:non-specific serine/threonine protein kinase/serine/threonine-protein kinase